MKNQFKDWKFPEFNHRGKTKWNWMCQYHEKLKLGNHVDIGAYSYINAKYGVELQNYVQIGSHCSLYSVSTIDNKKGRILVKENARIGTHSTVMPGVKIGKNSIIGAFSFVSQNIPDNVLAYGVPVKIIRKLKSSEKKVSRF